MQQPIRVLIVDDHDAVRMSLENFLATCDDMQLVGSASSETEAVQLSTEVRPDIVLMDIMMSGEPSGIQAAQLILQRLPETRIIALSSFFSIELIQAALQAGITSYLIKNTSIDELADAIRAVYQGEHVISLEVARLLDKGNNQNDLPAS